jgi:ABC-type dipeptide/oligopeptide/nickel transport system permease subunit
MPISIQGSRDREGRDVTDAALPLQSDADQRAIAALRRKNAVWRRILKDPAAALAAIFLFAVVVAAMLAPWIAPFDPYASSMRFARCPIGSARCAQFLLGADQTGRDMVSRLLFGLRSTLAIGLVAVLIGGSIGTTIGLLAAYYRRLETPLMRLIDVLLSFPPILFGLAIAAVVGAGLPGLVLALCVTSIPTIARIARSAAASIMQQEYMEAGRAVGLGDGALLWRYLAINCWPTILIYMTLQLGQAILLGAALSFLGLGAQPPVAELGSMAADGRKFLTIAPHISTLPCAVIFLVVLAFNILGDALRDALDPRLRQ